MAAIWQISEVQGADVDRSFARLALVARKPCKAVPSGVLRNVRRPELRKALGAPDTTHRIRQNTQRKQTLSELSESVRFHQLIGSIWLCQN